MHEEVAEQAYFHLSKFVWILKSDENTYFFVFSSLQWLLETGVFLQCHVLKKSTRHQTCKWRLVFLLQGHFFLFKNFLSDSPVVINAPNGCNIWKSFFASEAYKQQVQIKPII